MMTAKSYIYIILLVVYGIIHLIRVYDGTYKGTAFMSMPGLYIFERFFIPMLAFMFAIGHFIPQKNNIPGFDGFIQSESNLLWLFLLLIIINFFVLQKYPVVWERNLCIALPTIIVFMMFLGYFGIW